MSLVANRRLSGQARRVALLSVSASFYATMDLVALAPLSVVVVTSWACGLVVLRHRHRSVLAVSVLSVLGPLFAAKYWPWLRDAFAHGVWWDSAAPGGRGVPLGLSFLSLQAVGYVADVWSRRVTPTARILDHAFYLCFFPQLVAGPIERTASLRPQLESPAQPTHTDFYGAGKLVLWGYTLKLLLADPLAAPIGSLLSMKGSVAGGALLLALGLFSARLYFDFLAYSCISVALARAHGVRLTFNFLHPYTAIGFREFWRRWHISLSTWWRDYVYIPLGGRQGSATRRFSALLCSFLLSGLWHGAGLGFLFWGAVHGLAVACERAIRSRRWWRHRRPTWHHATARSAGTIFTATFVTVCWLPFLASSMHPTVSLVERLVVAVGAGRVTFQSIFGLLPTLLVPLTICVTGLVLDRPMQRWWLADPPSGRVAIAQDLALTNAMVLGLLLFGDFGGRSFIYFAF